MTDIGFGLSDRRSVMVVVLTILLSKTLFNHLIPIDTGTVVDFAASLFILVGFIYLVRSTLRILWAFAFLLLRVIYGIITYLRRQNGNARKITSCLSESFLETMAKPLFLEQEWKWKYSMYDTGITGKVLYAVGIHTERRMDLGILGMLDRASLVGTAFVSTLPGFSNTLHWIGLVGMGLLVLIFVATGRFSLVLKDMLHKSREEHEQLISAVQNPKIPRD